MRGEERSQRSDVLRLEVVLETMRLHDEQLARDELAYLLKSIGDVEVVAHGKNGLEAVNLIREHERGRALAEILEDPYVRNRTTPLERERLLDRPEFTAAEILVPGADD